MDIRPSYPETVRESFDLETTIALFLERFAHIEDRLNTLESRLNRLYTP